MITDWTDTKSYDCITLLANNKFNSIVHNQIKFSLRTLRAYILHVETWRFLDQKSKTTVKKPC